VASESAEIFGFWYFCDNKNFCQYFVTLLSQAARGAAG
jgi:hypothetical protein